VPTTNARRAIKGSKDANLHLVYFKRKNGQIATLTFFSGPDYIMQKFLDLSPVVTSHQKKF